MFFYSYDKTFMCSCQGFLIHLGAFLSNRRISLEQRGGWIVAFSGLTLGKRGKRHAAAKQRARRVVAAAFAHTHPPSRGRSVPGRGGWKRWERIGLSASPADGAGRLRRLAAIRCPFPAPSRILPFPCGVGAGTPGRALQRGSPRATI